ncbi:XRE family transcriptional regulator [Acinetobacter haemolyticus]|uniref:XRE family transcriptional regulator n=1 Tax=Acinetobacter haemolyticus TaxID=29430 RepID=UPI0021CD43B5|nr:XRE family transcriptional regulator [Acinetobacter haemolyticus]MCU4378256.1 peptidase S24 [Acinetobacter haemolyticus]
MTIGARLKEERERLGFTQPAFAELAGTTKKSQIDYEKDSTQPKASYLANIATIGADILYIVTGLRLIEHGKEQKGDFSDEFDLVNVYDVAISAGHGSICTGDAKPISRLAFRKDWLSKNGLYSKDLIIVHATGDSMFPTIEDKEPLLVNTIDKSLTDGFIYVIRTGEHFWVKRIQRQIDGSILLISDNKTYPPMQLDLNEASDIEILGKWIPPSRGTFY